MSYGVIQIHINRVHNIGVVNYTGWVTFHQPPNLISLIKELGPSYKLHTNRRASLKKKIESGWWEGAGETYVSKFD